MGDLVVTWGDLIKIVLILISAGILFYLLLAVANLVGILKNINKMLASNRANIDSTLDKLPVITENIAKVSDIVKDEMESIQKVIGNVGKISDSARDAVEVIKKDIIVKAKNILDIIEWIRNLFQDKGGKKKEKEIVYKYKYKPAAETVEEIVIDQESGDDIGEEKPDGEKEAEKGNA